MKRKKPSANGRLDREARLKGDFLATATESIEARTSSEAASPQIG